MSYRSGLSLVEVVIGTAIITAFLLAAIAAFQTGLVLNGRNLRLGQATFLVEEGMEALKLMRDAGYSTQLAPLTPGQTYYFTYSPTGWQATSTNEYVAGQFERSFVLSTVARDNISKDIVTSGGSLDPKTLKAVVRVAWREGAATTTKTVGTYITNLFDN